MSAHDPPTVILSPNHAGYPQGDRSHLVAAADLDTVSLDLDEACEVPGCVGCDSFEPDGLAIPVIGRGPSGRLRDPLPAADERAERIAEGDILPTGEEFQRGRRISLEELPQRQVGSLDHRLRVIHLAILPPDPVRNKR